MQAHIWIIVLVSISSQVLILIAIFVVRIIYTLCVMIAFVCACCLVVIPCCYPASVLMYL